MGSARVRMLGCIILVAPSICPGWAQDRGGMGIPVEIENDRRQPLERVQIEYAIEGVGVFAARSRGAGRPRVDVRAGQRVMLRLEHAAFDTRNVPLKIPSGIVGIHIVVGSSATTAVALVDEPRNGPRGDSVNAGGTPANDECLGMISIPCNGSVVADNTTATTAVDDPVFSCRFGGPGQGINSIWYSFVATETRAIVDTEGSVAPADDSLIAVYSGACGTLVELACSDDDGTGLLSSVTIDGLTVGETYIIQLASFLADDSGAYMLNVACSAPPDPPDVELCFGIEEFEAEEDELELCAAFDAGADFDPRKEDLTINVIDEDGDVFSFNVPGDAFEEDDDDEFEAEFETDELEIELEFDLDDCELELEIEGEDDEEPFEGLDGPEITIELVFSESGSIAETIIAEKDDDELEFEAEDEPECCSERDLTTGAGAAPRFDIDSERVLLGEQAVFEASGTPGAPVQIILVGANGIHASLPVAAGLFDANGRFTLRSRTVRDPTLHGMDLTFVARTIGSRGELQESDRERLLLRFSKSRLSFPR